jgi:hypothetical protein
MLKAGKDPVPFLCRNRRRLILTANGVSEKFGILWFLHLSIGQFHAFAEPGIRFLRIKDPAPEVIEYKPARQLAPKPADIQQSAFGVDVAHGVNAIAGKRRTKFFINGLVLDGAAIEPRFLLDGAIVKLLVISSCLASRGPIHISING